MKLRLVAMTCLAGIFFTASANATTFFIDELQITKNNNPNWFVDGFDDGVVPPSSESVFPDGASAFYSTFPNPLPGPEQNSRVQMNTDEGKLTPSSVSGTSILLQRARVLTNTSNDPNNNAGLKENHTFEVRGLFDLIEPTLEREVYGIRLTDFGSADPNDNTQLQVQKSPTGEWRVRFIEADVGLGVFDELDSFLLPTVAQLGQYEQIALMLTKGDVANRSITASFELIDTDLSLPSLLVGMGGSAELFDGERWTRAGFLAVQVVPVPATLLLMGLGLAGLGYQRTRQKAA